MVQRDDYEENAMDRSQGESCLRESSYQHYQCVSHPRKNQFVGYFYQGIP